MTEKSAVANAHDLTGLSAISGVSGGASGRLFEGFKPVVRTVLAECLDRFLARVLARAWGGAKSINTVYSTTRHKEKPIKITTNVKTNAKTITPLTPLNPHNPFSKGHNPSIDPFKSPFTLEI